MPVTVAFTITSLVALVFNVWFMMTAIRQRRRLIASGQNGKMKIIANAFIQVWTAILIIDLVMILSGLGILAGHREFGYLIATVPICSLMVGVFAVRGLL